jgi:alkylhydroperoxidase/carboxymuconolactone decarboxylase family protein YurZ
MKSNVWQEMGAVGERFMEMVRVLSKESALDEKTHHLAYLAVMAATGLHDGVAWHVKALKKQGATRGEIKSAVLVGLPAVGLHCTQPLALALEAYDEA